MPNLCMELYSFNSLYSIEAINGVGFLLSMLETKVKSLKTQAELSAAERVQKKSAIALSRYVFEYRTRPIEGRS